MSEADCWRETGYAESHSPREVTLLPLLSPGPARSTVCVFLVGTQETCSLCTYICTWLAARTTTGTQSAHTGAGSSGSLILLPSLAEQGRSALMGCARTRRVDPAELGSGARPAGPRAEPVSSLGYTTPGPQPRSGCCTGHRGRVQANGWPGLSGTRSQVCPSHPHHQSDTGALTAGAGAGRPAQPLAPGH